MKRICFHRVRFLFQVKLADRSLLPGDVVKFSNVSKGTQKGFVSNVEVVASVKVLVANQIFHNVDCKGLSPLQVQCDLFFVGRTGAFLWCTLS